MDGWKAYNTLEQEGYTHGVVNHSEEFDNIDDPEINTQEIERLWKSLKNEPKREQEKTTICISSNLFTCISKETGAGQHHKRYFHTFSATSRLYIPRIRQTGFTAGRILLRQEDGDF